MREIIVKAPKWADLDGAQKWPARFTVSGSENVRVVQIESRSWIDIVIAKDPFNYYISSPNFGVAIPGIGSMSENHWIAEKLIQKMPAPDALTVAAVLQEIGDF